MLYFVTKTEQHFSNNINIALFSIGLVEMTGPSCLCETSLLLWSPPDVLQKLTFQHGGNYFLKYFENSRNSLHNVFTEVALKRKNS